jgi:competence protein ComFC
VVEINPQTLEGNWLKGFALDFQTTSSTPIGHNEFGHMQFDTVRPPIAELLYQLKYKSNREAAQGIIDIAGPFVARNKSKFDLIIPVPPSSQRAVQPVLVLAEGIGRVADLPVVECVTATRPTTQLKGVTDREERKRLLDGLYAVDARYTAGKKVLLFDDLYRSGSTMNAITDLLLGPGRAAAVRVLTITKTRSNR